MTKANRNLSILLQALVIAAALSTTSCGDSEKYGKEIDRETVLEVSQPPYKFHMTPKHTDGDKTTLKITIEKDGAPVENAQVSAKLVTHDGAEQTVKFEEEKTGHSYESSADMKHHEDYLVKTEIIVDTKTMSPIFAFHNDDPALEKRNSSKDLDEKH